MIEQKCVLIKYPKTYGEQLRIPSYEKEIEKYLVDGWYIKLFSPIEKDLYYILEREVKK